MLKKLLTAFVLFSGVAFSSHAQSFTVSVNPVDTTVPGQDPCTGCGGVLGYPITVGPITNITNTSSNSLSITWKVIESNMLTGWVNTGVCDNNQCFSDDSTVNGLKTHTANPIAPGASFTLTADYYVPKTGANGTSTIKVLLNAFPQSDTVVFNVTKNTTGVSVVTLKDNRVALYPNPATANNMFVYADKALNATHITVVNIMGQTVLSTDLSKSAEVTSLNINSLTKGSYFVRIIDTKGQLVTARQFIKE